jgi:hypothetical protein
VVLVQLLVPLVLVEKVEIEVEVLVVVRGDLLD